MERKIVITEETEQKLIGDILTEGFTPDREKVLIVKEFLDDGFSPVVIDDIDANGYPKKVKMVNMVSGGQPLKTMRMRELLLMLMDKFAPMITDESDRKKFLEEIVREWYSGKLSKNGLLAVNFIK